MDRNFIEEIECNLNERFCCGNCELRKCCRDMNLRIDQYYCKESCLFRPPRNTNQNGKNNNNFNNNYGPPNNNHNSICEKETPFCCGTCSSASCCDTKFRHLNQTICSNEVKKSTTKKNKPNNHNKNSSSK